MDWTEAFDRAWSTLLAQVVLAIVVLILEGIGLALIWDDFTTSGKIGGVSIFGGFICFVGFMLVALGSMAIWLKAIGDIVSDIVYEAQEEQVELARRRRRRTSRPSDPEQLPPPTPP
ncbi:MAG: hypothetical protein ACE5Q6_24440 [Dehalococcoidia bacterium]